MFDEHMFDEMAESIEAIALKAFYLGVLSGISMPIGVVLGILFTPVSDHVCGGILAFGGGALLFAVTISIYGKTLKEYSDGRIGELESVLSVISGLVGAYFYLAVSRWLENEEPEDTGPEGDAEKALMHEVQPLFRQISAPKAALTNRRRRAIYSAVCELEDAMTRLRDMMDVELRSPRPTSALQEEAKEDAEKKEKNRQALNVASSLFLGLLIDGVPEALFMGLLAAEDLLSPALVVSLFIANFPEAFSAASLMESAGMSFRSIMALWGGLCLLVGLLCGVSCYAVQLKYPMIAKKGEPPHNAELGFHIVVKLIEGFTGGAMLACITALMLPEAHERVGKAGSVHFSSGFLAVTGFLSAVAFSVVFDDPL
mmetsp:Transcript_60417/g.107660  ORF Transcript_60417/g.107660 Transcript_60417/m.107660 type:complete len:371 (+) Transcript_60417:70-1182(+)